MTVFYTVVSALMVLAAALIVFRPFALPGTQLQSKVVGLSVAGIAILGGVALYVAIGRPDVIDKGHAPMPQRVASSPAQTTGSDKGVDSVDSLVGGLAARLEREPDDADGWLLLAKSYAHLDRLDEAAVAYVRATQLGQYDATLEDRLNGVVGAPDGDTVEATAGIRGRVSVRGPQLDENSVVFITAKRTDGSPMPIAVLKRSASELPFDFVLNDEHSMMSGINLSQTESVIVSAKISATGDALQTGSSLEARSAPVKVSSAEFVDLVIDTGD